MKLFTIILFAITYILMIALPKKRPYVALISAVIFVVSGAMPLGSVFSAIDWNVLLMLAGTMGTVALFIESKMPERMAEDAQRHVGGGRAVGLRRRRVRVR